MFCTDIPAPVYLIFSEFTPQILYYSHIPTALLAVAFGVFLLWHKRTLYSELILSVAVFYTLWSIADLILWTTIDGRMIMFFWAIINLLQTMVVAATLYFTYVFLEKKDAVLKWKMAAAAIFLPYILLLPTTLNLEGFNLALCEGIEGPFINYFYFAETLFIAWTAVYVIRKFMAVPKNERAFVGFFAAGVLLFLLSFSGANILASITDQWTILQYGLFGMPVFLGFLTYLIVKYKAFNAKLLASEALVVSLWFLLAALLFLQDIQAAHVVVGITLFFFTILGYQLIASVHREGKQLDEIKKLAGNLSVANEKLREIDHQKSDFVSIAAHQLRGPLTAINGYSALMVEGSYGKIEGEQRDTIEKILYSGKLMASAIDDFLNVARIEQGRIRYDFSPDDLAELLKHVTDDFTFVAKEKGLEFNVDLPKGYCMVRMDRGKIKQVLTNLIDNAIKYTIKGSVTVELSMDTHKGKALVSIKDTGIGVSDKACKTLFDKFTRAKNANTSSIQGTGIGLFVAKEFIKAHDGRLWVESEGERKGSTFFVELDLILKKDHDDEQASEEKE